jgi:hypothetical protein
LYRNEVRYALYGDLIDIIVSFSPIVDDPTSGSGFMEVNALTEEERKAAKAAAVAAWEAFQKGDMAAAETRGKVSRGANDLGVLMKFGALLAAYNELDRSLEKPRKSPLTAEMEALDAERITTFRRLKADAKYFLRNDLATKREAARRTLILIDTYRNIAGTGYADRTGKIANLVEDLLDPDKGQADTALLGLTNRVNTLSVQNDAFIAKEEERAAQWTWVEGAPLPVPQAFAAVEDVLVEMFNIITGKIINEGRAAYEVFIQTVNNLFQTYNNAAASRLGRKKNNNNNSGGGFQEV